MKKYFTFDDEPISGSDYLLRVILGSFLVFVLVGIWILAATGYKRGGAIGLDNNQRILAAIFVPVMGVINMFGLFTNSFLLLVTVIGSIFHFGLLIVNGNKSNSIQLPTFYVSDCKIKEFENLEIKLKFDNYSKLYFQIIGQLSNDFKGFHLNKNTKISFQLFDKNNEMIQGKYLLLRILDTTVYNPYIKERIFRYEGNMNIQNEQFLNISYCDLIIS